MMKQNELNQKLVNHAKYFQKEVRKNIAIAISAAFAFILALYWKDLITEGVNKILEYLKNYRWSSYLDYVGKKNFPSLTNRSFLSKVLGGAGNYKKETMDWVRKMDYSIFQEVALE